MYQELIAYILLIAALVFGAYKVYKYFSASKDPCDDCHENSDHCSIYELKKEAEKKRSRKS